MLGPVLHTTPLIYGIALIHTRTPKWRVRYLLVEASDGRGMEAEGGEIWAWACSTHTEFNLLQASQIEVSNATNSGVY